MSQQFCESTLKRSLKCESPPYQKNTNTKQPFFQVLYFEKRHKFEINNDKEQKKLQPTQEKAIIYIHCECQTTTFPNFAFYYIKQYIIERYKLFMLQDIATKKCNIQPVFKILHCEK